MKKLRKILLIMGLFAFIPCLFYGCTGINKEFTYNGKENFGNSVRIFLKTKNTEKFYNASDFRIETNLDTYRVTGVSYTEYQRFQRSRCDYDGSLVLFVENKIPDNCTYANLYYNETLICKLKK